MFINSDYVEKNLIAYIGNKRRLLDLIQKSIFKTNLLESNKKVRFLDLFAGTGVVSRLAKSLGLEVHTNDWEYYSYIMNKTFIELDNTFLQKSFKVFGGVKNVITILNNLSNIDEESSYISKYYCPENDDNPDLDNERMFWTRYNGEKIDLVRTKIAEWKGASLITDDEELFLIALLIYEASTRSNTSGVFKGFHRGFGGSNGDALTRIMKKIELSLPVLIDGEKSYVYNEDAISLSEKMKNVEFDIVYLDPPYNQHQYGSNYHLLNTIALNDKPFVNKDVILNGKKVNKSAIRKDWIKTKSSFCYKKKAIVDFKKVIENINSRFILVSYSTDGIIPFDEMLNILSSKGKISINMAEYVKFRGGKQALTSEVNNIEFILSVDTSLKSDSSDIKKINTILSANRISLIMKKTINPILAESIGFLYKNRVSEDDLSIEKILVKKYDNFKVEYTINKNRITEKSFTDLMELPSDILFHVLSDLEYITNLTKEDEIYLSLNEIEKYYEKGAYNEVYEIFKKIPHLLSKFNNKKAYGAGLKCICDLLKLMNKTSEVWQEFNILETNNFAKLEKIILLKINYNSGKEEEFVNLKNQISSSYETLLDQLESNTKNSVKKGVKPLKKKQKAILLV